MNATKVTKLALIGIPGAGKSTVRGYISDFCSLKGVPIRVIKLAAPLYEAQSIIYSLCSRDLEDFYSQDGELLTFLGAHMRKINPNVLTDRFNKKLKEEEAHLFTTGSDVAVILCDDARPKDVEYLRQVGFRLLKVVADTDECMLRKQRRNDLSLSSPSHPVEIGTNEVETEWVIDNRGSFQELKEKVFSIMEEELV